MVLLNIVGRNDIRSGNQDYAGFLGGHKHIESLCAGEINEQIFPIYVGRNYRGNSSNSLVSFLWLGLLSLSEMREGER